MFVEEAITKKYYNPETDESFALVWKKVLFSGKIPPSKELAIKTLLMPKDSKMVVIPNSPFFVIAGYWGR